MKNSQENFGHFLILSLFIGLPQLVFGCIKSGNLTLGDKVVEVLNYILPYATLIALAFFILFIGKILRLKVKGLSQETNVWKKLFAWIFFLILLIVVWGMVYSLSATFCV